MNYSIMKFLSFYWPSHHGLISQYNMLYKYGKRHWCVILLGVFFVDLVSCIFDILNYLLLLEKHIYSNFLSLPVLYISSFREKQCNLVIVSTSVKVEKICCCLKMRIKYWQINKEKKSRLRIPTYSSKDRLESDSTLLKGKDNSVLGKHPESTSRQQPHCRL